MAEQLQSTYRRTEWSGDMTSDEASTTDNLKALCTAGLDRLNRHGSINAAYVEQVILPELGSAVRGISSRIEDRHRIPTAADNVTAWVTHYTSLSTVTTMLRELADGQEAVLRLYDTSHSNDPDEGNHLVRELSSKDGYRWLALESSVGHAYVTSFVGGQDGVDMSDDLVFWRSYGKDGKGCSLTVSVRADLLRRVFYIDSEIESTRQMILPVLDAVAPLARADAGCAELISAAIWKHLEGTRYLYKDVAYHHENEHRIAIPAESSDIEPSRIQFQPYEADGPIVEVRHYCEIDGLGLGQILSSGSKLTLGPAVEDSYSVRLYLNDLKRRALMQNPDLNDFEINASKIRYSSR